MSAFGVHAMIHVAVAVLERCKPEVIQKNACIVQEANKSNVVVLTFVVSSAYLLRTVDRVLAFSGKRRVGRYSDNFCSKWQANRKTGHCTKQ